MRGHFFPLCCILLLGGQFSDPVFAQPQTLDVRSLESSVANARLIYVGTIASIAKASQPKILEKARILVRRTIKGPHKSEREASLSIPIDLLEPARKDAEERDPPADVLLFDFGEREPCTIIPLTKPLQQDIFLADFTRLSNPEKLVAETDRIARETVGTTRQQTFRLSVPLVHAANFRSYYQTGGYVRLEIPVNPQLETRAKLWLDDRNTSPLRASDAVAALRYFKSQENIALVRSLLKEHLGIAENRPKEMGPEPTVRAARQTLRYWGVDP